MKQDTKNKGSLPTGDLPHTLQNITNKDLVTEANAPDLLATEAKGQKHLNSFVEETDAC